MFGFQSRKPARKTTTRLGIEILEDRSVPVADLTVGAAAPAVVAPGETLTTQFTVTNRGDTTAAGSWADAVFLSADGTRDLGDSKLLERSHAGGLAAGGSYAVTAGALVPNALGLRHVIVETDFADAVPEPAGGFANTWAVPVAVVPAFTVGFVRGITDQLQTAFGAANAAMPLQVTEVTTTATGAAVKLQKNPGLALSVAGFTVTDVTVTVTGTLTAATAQGTVKLVAPAGGGTTDIVATLLVGTDGVLKIDGTATVPEIRLGTDAGLFLKTPTLTADIDIHLGTRAVSGGVTVTAARAVVFASAVAGQDPAGPVAVTDVSASLTSTGVFTGTAKGLTVTAGSGLRVTAADAAFTYNPALTNGTLITVGRASARAIAFGKDITLAVTDLRITRDARVSVGSITTDALAALPKVRVAEVLPFAVTSVTVAGIDNQAATLDAFDLTVAGTFDFSVFDGLPATPVVRIGARNVSSGASAFTFTLRNDRGDIRVQETGQIQFGFSGLAFPPLTLGTTVTLGGFVNGAFAPSPFGATFDLKADTTAVDFSVAAAVTGGIAPADAAGNIAINLTGTFTADFKFSNGTVDVNDASLKFKLGWTVNPDGGRVGTPVLSLEGLDVGDLKVKVGDLMTFTAADAAFDFRATGDNPILRFGSAGVVFNSAGGVLNGWGGTAYNFGVASDGKLILLPGARASLTIPPNFKFGLPDWLPVSFTKVGLSFPGAGEPVGTTGLNLPAPKKLADAANFSFIVSGGLTANTVFPVTAQLTDLEVNVGDMVRTLKGEAGVPFPVRNLSGVNVAVAPFELGKGFQVGGQLSFGTVAVGGKDVLYGRVKGGLKYQDVGADVDVILSSVGPVMATVSAPLAVPLGPSGAVLSGVSGGILFGSTVPTVTDPRDLLGSNADPRFRNPLDQANAHPLGVQGFIADSVRVAVAAGTSTVSTAFTLVLAGTFTHVASPGILTARATLAANVNPRSSAAAPAGLKLLGFGDVYLQGMPLGDSKIVLDLSSPLAPKIAVAFQTPTPGSPIAFLLPASGTLVASLDTKGLAIGTAIGVKTFVQKVATGTAGVASGFFAGVLDRVADRIAADPTRPLAKFVLDTDANGTVSPAELAVVNNPAAFRATFRARLLALLPSDFAAVSVAPGATFDAKLARLAGIAQAATAELFDAIAAAQKATASPQSFDAYLGGFADGLRAMAGEGGKALLAFADVVKDAVASAAQSAADQFDPVLVVSGKLQPTLLGIPFGPSKNSVDLRVSKTGLAFGTDFSLGNFVTALATGGLSQALNVPLPVSDNLRVDVQLPFADVFRDLALGRLPTMDPVYGQWLIGIGGAVDVLGYRVGPVSGLLFPRNNPGLLAQRVQIVDANGDGVRDAALDPAKIQVADPATFAKLVASGGLLLDGTLTAPKLLTDPAGLARLVGAGMPDPQADAAGFLNRLMQLPQSLGQLDALAQVQTFLPLAGGRAADAYLTGKLAGTVLSVELGSGTLSATRDKLLISGTYLGATATLAVDKSSTGLPRAAAEVTVGTSTLAAVFAGLGLPADLFAAPTSGANAKLRLYSPGFDTASSDPLKKSGGVELTAKLNLPGVVENATFLFRMTPPTVGALPNFQAKATVASLAIPGLAQAGVLRLKDFAIDLTKSGATTTLRLNGKADLFGTDLKADGTFTLTAAGLYGAFELKSLSGGAVPNLGGDLGFTLDGRVWLLLNTTAAARMVAVNGRSVSVPARTGKLHADGTILAGGFALDGRFDLAAGTGGLAVTADAALRLGQFGSYAADGSFTIRSTGLVANLTVTPTGGQSADFALTGTFTLRLNTTGVTLNGVSPGATLGVSSGRLTLNGLGSAYRLYGSMTVGFKDNPGTSGDYFYLSVPRSEPLTATLWGGAVGESFYGEVRSNGYLDLTATGVLRTESGGWGFDLDLTVRIRSTAGGLSFSASATGGVTFLGFELFDVDVAVTAAGRVTVSAKYQVWDLFSLSWKTERIGVSFDLA